MADVPPMDIEFIASTETATGLGERLSALNSALKNNPPA